MRQDTVTSPITPAAGRRFTYYPQCMGTISQTGDVNATQGNQRFNNLGSSTDINLWLTNVNGVPPAGHKGAVYLGRTCWKLTAGAATGYQFTQNNAAARAVTMPISLVRSVGSSPSPADDFFCWEFSYILAWDAFVGNIAANGDSGISVGVNTRCLLRNSNFAGIEVGPINATTSQLGVYIQQTDGAGPSQQTTLSPVGFDYTKWNKLAIRFVGATLAAEAQCRIVVNDVVALSVPYGAGTVLPDQFVGAAMGFGPGIAHFQPQGATTTVMYLAARGGIVSYAPTEALLV